MNWFKKKIALAGSVLFRGAMPPRPEEFDFTKSGISATKETPSAGIHWHLKLNHPKWGDADLICFRDMPPPPRELIEYERLTQSEKEEALAGQSLVSFRMEPREHNILRDRKTALRFLRAVMGSDGIAVLDHVSNKVWSRIALDEELSHDADLDVEGLFTVHAVTRGNAVHWMHTHGLREIGFFDFDVLDPSEDLHSDGNGSDVFRAIAFAIVEGHAKIGDVLELARPNGDVAMVDLQNFVKAAPRYSWLLSDHGNSELSGRTVVCEPGSGGFFWRIMGGSTRPSKLLSRPLPDDGLVFTFSAAASQLMSARARGTYPVFRKLIDEFAEFPFPTAVKLGYECDGGSGHEYLWFQVHSAGENELDATLSNSPFEIASLKAGDRGKHSIELLADWSIFTPFGVLSPRNMIAARFIREKKEILRKALQKSASVHTV